MQPTSIAPADGFEGVGVALMVEIMATGNDWRHLRCSRRAILRHGRGNLPLTGGFPRVLPFQGGAHAGGNVSESLPDGDAEPA